MNFELINNNDFKNLINISFTNVLQGFKEYKHIELAYANENKYEAEKKFIKTIEEFYEINKGNLIIDFYKNNLNDKSIEIMKKNLESDDIILLDEFMNFTSSNCNYYKINHKKYIKLFTKLCTRELYFISFYFYKNPITIWGNYNMKFPLFYDTRTNIKEYICIAKSNNLY